MNLLGQNLQIIQQMTDVPSTQRQAGAWALHLVDLYDAMLKLNRFKGQIVSTGDKQRIDDLAERLMNEVEQLVEMMTRLAETPAIRPIINNALEKAVAARPSSALAQLVRLSNGQINPVQSVVAATRSSGQNSGAAVAHERMTEMKERARLNREASRARTDAMRERHSTTRNRARGMQPGRRP
ncbi:MAG TPA: hypothetical protein VGJ26_02445 [Pirellulales bacterium]